MKTMVGVERLDPPEEGTAVTIGTFDGVHIGHRALIAAAVGGAADRNIASAIVTWDRHPATTLRPDRVPPLLTTPERKVELLTERGADILAILPFDAELSKWPPERFVSDVLVKGLAARAVFVGPGWRFGHKASGDVALLRAMGDDLGFEVTEVDLQEIAGHRVSSSKVRTAVTSGDVDQAAALLGRPFDVDGIVVPGAARGKELGFPTANLQLDPNIAHPARGVYAGRSRVEESWFKAAINVGVNPTFGGDPAIHPLSIEAYLLDHDSDLYGQALRVEFWSRLRDELTFPGPAELIEQMGRDVAATRRIVP